jgi:polar amino acid transport system substrate-binding protein
LSKGVLWTVIDISKRKVLEEEIQQRTEEIEFKNKQLRELASKDHLTGLYNRSKLDETLEYQFKHSKRSNTPFGLILIDIDFFKSVNDEHGHQAGDTILCEFSSLLTRYSRECDVVGRWGGEEFLIIVEDTDEKSIVVFAEKLRKTIELYQFSIVKHKTSSFGATIYHSEDKPNTGHYRIRKK